MTTHNAQHVDDLSYLEKIVDFAGGIDRGPITGKEILIYSPAKTGTTSLFHSIGAYCTKAFSWEPYQNRLLHNHHNAALLNDVRPTSTDVTDSFLQKRMIVRDLVEYKRNMGQKLLIVSSYREPISRFISHVFNEIHDHLFVSKTHSVEDYDYAACLKLLINHLDIKDTLHPIEEIEPNFFNKETFDKENKYLLVDRGHYKILMLCLEHSDKWQDILSSQLGFDGIKIPRANQANQKAISVMYKEFKERLRLPNSMMRNIYYDGPFAEHLKWFYTEEEVDNFYKTSLSLYGQKGSSFIPFSYIRYRTEHTARGAARFLYIKTGGLIRSSIRFVHNSPRIKSVLLEIIKHSPNLAEKAIDYAHRSLSEDNIGVTQWALDRARNRHPEITRMPELDEFILNRIETLRINPPTTPRIDSNTSPNKRDSMEYLGSGKRPLKKGRPIMAYISPMPPAPSGISYYSCEILPALSKHYEIVVVVNQDDATDKDFTVRNLDWFRENYTTFDRVMYHMGNSVWHSHMVELLDRHPGVIVLHDIYLGHMLDAMDAGVFDRHLYLSHGYPGLRYKQAHDRNSVIWNLPLCCSLISSSYGVIVHSDYAKEQLKNSCDNSDEVKIVTTPLANKLPSTASSDGARSRLGLPNNKVIVCCFGGIGPTKLNDRLVQVWSTLSSNEKNGALLIFVGGLDKTFYIKGIAPILEKTKVSSSVTFTDYVTEGQYQDYLLAADVAVQLRKQSRGESSRSILECMAYGLPTIVNDHGSNRELPSECLINIPENFTDSELQEQLSTCIKGGEHINALGKNARQYISEHRTPELIADSYHNHIELIYRNTAEKQTGKLLEILNLYEDKMTPDCTLPKPAAKLAATYVNNHKRVYADISEIVKHDGETGIQRVAKNVIDGGLDILHEEDARLEPVYIHNKKHYFARRYMFNKYLADWLITPDMPVRFSKGDIFIGLDFTINQHPYLVDVLSEIKDEGTKVNLLIYDLLPILSPLTFRKDVVNNFRLWLNAVVTVADGVICISKSVADEMLEWLAENPPKRSTPLNIGYFHLGSNLEEQILPKPQNHIDQIHMIETKKRQTVLMVGTIEPRKGYAQAFSAFDLLWKKGFDVNLVIVGKEGWMIDDLAENMRSHPEHNKRFFWLDNADDSALEELYREATVLLAASKGEGFGLPIVEAASRGTPVIVRDIPVFREVAGEGGFYFKGQSAEYLAEKIHEWFSLFALAKTPKPQLVKTVTWQESSRQLYDILLHDNWYQKWSGS